MKNDKEFEKFIDDILTFIEKKTSVKLSIENVFFRACEGKKDTETSVRLIYSLAYLKSRKTKFNHKGFKYFLDYYDNDDNINTIGIFNDGLNKFEVSEEFINYFSYL